MLTTAGTFASRAPIRPYTPGLGLWVWTMSGCSRRKWSVASRNAAQSPRRSMARVERSSATWRIPAASSSGTNGPGADMPMTS